MKPRLILLPLLLWLVSCSRPEGRMLQPVDYVSTLVGTQSKHSLSTGNTYPAIAMPWGTHFWTPQTGRMGDGWAYVYTEDKIRGFKMTHQPSPWMNDYGQFSLMPVTTGAVWDEDARASWFSHKAESAKPYYYGVYLADHDTYLEITPTERAAAFRITYPERETSYLVVDGFAGSKCTISGSTISGVSTINTGGVAGNFALYFVVECDTPFTSVKQVDEHGRAYAIVGFPTSKGQKVGLRVAASFISHEQALTNLLELGDGDFDRLCADGRERWNEVLSRIEIEDGNIDHLRTFYSCLYRSVLFPRDFSEITAEGRRVHYSPHDGKVHDGYLFTDTGLWDTFRSQFSLTDLVYPEMASKMQEGFLNHYLESGFIPEWSSPGHRGCMIGNNSASVVAEAWLKGIRGDYDIETLWDALVGGAHSVHPTVDASGRLGYDYYDELGYVPCDVGINESAARTLEYAYDDWCIWQLGKDLCKSEEELAPYEKASQNYRKLFREDYGLMGGRNADGSFPAEFNPLKWGGDFTEGNSLHYTWSVFHDPAGLMDLMGGKEAFEAKLDGVFSMPPDFDDSYYGFTIHEIREMQIMNMGNYAHGNQPIQHMLYLYNWCGSPWKAQARIREVMEKFYTPAPDGYCGDEDNGQTSAWYVFSALGFYPVCPTSTEYALGTPLFRKATVHLPGGNLVVRAGVKGSCRASAGDSDKIARTPYVDNFRINGRRVTRNYLRHNELTGGARLDFTLSDSPNLSRGTKTEDLPYSYSNN